MLETLKLDPAKILIACICLILSGFALLGAIMKAGNPTPFLIFAGVIGTVGLLLIAGQVIRSIRIGKGGGELVAGGAPETMSAPTAALPTPEPLITEEQHYRRRVQFITKPAPGLRQGIPPFRLLEDPAVIRPVPGADPTIPIYRLDRNFRILDWNDAFSLAFDGTLEGRRGQNAQEWVFFLDNFQEVMSHGAERFGDPNNLPRFDYEELKYTSSRYGLIEAGKRAYQVPAPDGSVDSWICVLDLKFRTPDISLKFQLDLISVLRDDLLWSEYAVSYDRVLTCTAVYQELLDEVLGETGREDGLERLGPNARVIDLGAGTGNIALRLAEGGERRNIVAIDKNRFMLGALRSKCQKFLQIDRHQAGVIALKQDITNLYGLPDDQFDVAILNNVLYTLNDPMRCLREVCRVLRRGGQIRVTGPKKDSNLKFLFERIKGDIEAAGRWKEVADDYARVKEINEHRLGNMLFKWTSNDVAAMLQDAGFEGGKDGRIWRKDDIYAGQAMLLRAYRPIAGSSNYV